MIPVPGWRPTAAEYHADRSRWSPSMLAVLAASPQSAYRRFVAGTMFDPPVTEALAVGSVVHDLVLRSDGPLPVIVEPAKRLKATATPARRKARKAAEAWGLTTPEPPRGARGSAGFAAVEAANPGRLVVSEAEFARGHQAAQSILEPATAAARHARLVLVDSDGVSEWAARFEAGAVPSKAMLDRVTAFPSGRLLIGELKTTLRPDPSAFARAVIDYGYHVQGEHNRRAVEAVAGERPRFRWFWVSTHPPFEVGEAYLDDGEPFAESWWERAGREELDRRLTMLESMLGRPAEAWRHPWETADGPVPVLDPPRWATRREASAAVVDAF